MQTTLYPSLQKMVKQCGNCESGCDNTKHIPEDGVIVSPGVEIFRSGSNQGYLLHQSTVPVATVISLAMYNLNPKVNDTPLNAPEDRAVYEQRTRDKFKVAVHGAALSKADVLLMPDVGCGVFGNDPTLLGKFAGEVLKEYSGYFKKVVFTGKQEFWNAAAASLECTLVRHSAPTSEATLCKDCIVCRKPFLSVDSLAVALNSSGRRCVDCDDQSSLKFLHTGCADALSQSYPNCLAMTLPEVKTDPKNFLLALDIDSNGALSESEVRCVAAALASNSENWTEQNSKDFGEMFRMWDTDGSGELKLDEFGSGMPQEFLEWVRKNQ